MKSVFLIFLMLFFKSSFSQDDLLSLLSEENNIEYVEYAFKGTKIVNSPSIEMPSKGVLQLNIQHRFGPINSGSYNFFGLDFSQVRIGLDFGLYKWLAIGLGRSSSEKVIDFNSKIRLLRQIKNGFPFTFSICSEAAFKQPLNNDYDILNQLSYSHHFLFAKKMNRNLSIQLMPTIVHDNIVQYNSDNDKYSLGFGFRQKISKRVSVNGEYFAQINDKINNNILSLGFDIETGGHIFQLHLSNSQYMIASEYINNTVGAWSKGDIFFGFNISRVFKTDY
tara:strand:+ start:585 stop:1421 length:837 start_codon:yes stop_codon:yes gene_type:complete